MYFIAVPSLVNVSYTINLRLVDYILDTIMGIMMFCKLVIMTVMAFVWEVFVISTLSAYYIAEAIILNFTPSALRYQKSLRNKVVLVTGGAGGVGQELTIRLARQQAKVVVWDTNEGAMEDLKSKCSNEGHTIYTYKVDVTDRHNVYKNAELVKSEIGIVDILVNNAGIVCGNTFLDLPDHMIEKTYNVNILSHYWTTKAFLGDMLKKGRGHIVTMSSLTGLLGTYKCTDYSATKYATLGFHESLLTELKTHGHDNIHMTVVCPYFINTGMFDGCKPKNMPMLEPRDVAKRTITAIRNEEVMVTMPGWAAYVLSLHNMIPAKLGWLIHYRLIRGPQSMMGLRRFDAKPLPIENIHSTHTEVAAA